jgi:hypothetical protein
MSFISPKIFLDQLSTKTTTLQLVIAVKVLVQVRVDCDKCTICIHGMILVGVVLNVSTDAPTKLL